VLVAEKQPDADDVRSKVSQGVLQAADFGLLFA
jgi:hypothetical protein